MTDRLPRERETKLVRSIRVRLLHRFGIRLWRQNTGGFTDAYGHHVRFGIPGQADLTGVHKGRRWEIEIKRDGEKPTLRQEMATEHDCVRCRRILGGQYKYLRTCRRGRHQGRSHRLGGWM